MRNLNKFDINNFELECISKVFEYYDKEIVNHKEREISISFLLIKVMNILKKTKNKAVITKVLLLIISFLNNIPPDLYNNRGIEIDLLPVKYREKAISLLRQEFLYN